MNAKFDEEEIPARSSEQWHTHIMDMIENIDQRIDRMVEFGNETGIREDLAVLAEVKLLLGFTTALPAQAVAVLRAAVAGPGPGLG